MNRHCPPDLAERIGGWILFALLLGLVLLFRVAPESPAGARFREQCERLDAARSRGEITEREELEAARRAFWGP